MKNKKETPNLFNKKAKRLGLGVSVFAVVSLVSATMTSADTSAKSIKDYLTVNPEYERYVQDVKDGKGDKWGLVPNQFITNAPEKIEGRGGGAVLPASYSLLDEGTAPILKNQGSEDICWAYAVTSMAESSAKKNYDISLEFSPKQLDYLRAASPFSNYVAAELGAGGNFTLASLSLVSPYAPIEEATFFNKMKANDAELGIFSSFDQYNDYRSIFSPLFEDKNPYVKPMSANDILTKANYTIVGYEHYFGASDIPRIKKDLYENGAMYVGTFAPKTDNCWDAETRTIIDRGSEICDSARGHAMTVIGWDDNHVYTDPADGSQKTGAFIIQNSWGKSSLFDDYGVTADTLMDIAEGGGLLDGKSTQEIADLRTDLDQAIDEYDAAEYTYLGYSMSDTIDFATITDLKENKWDNIFDITNTDSVSVSNGRAIYHWPVNGAKLVDGISFGAFVELPFLTEYTLVINSAGKSTTKTVTIPAREQNRYYLELDEPITINGDASVTMIVRDATTGDEYLSDNETTGYFWPMLYANQIDGPTVPGGSVVPDGGKPNSDDLAVPNTGDLAVPNTGGFTRMNGGVIIAGIGFAIVSGIAIILTRFGYNGHKKNALNRILRSRK